MNNPEQSLGVTQKNDGLLIPMQSIGVLTNKD
jgi:hypothetical protein